MTRLILLTILLIFPLQLKAQEVQNPYRGPYRIPDNSYSAQRWINMMKNWKAEQQWTDPSDSINSALADLEIDYGSTDTPKQKKLLQFPGYGDNESP